MESVYLETSVISYLVAPISRRLIVAGGQQATQSWWETQSRNYQLYVSQLVVDEAGRGDAEQARRRLALMDQIPRLAPAPDVEDLTSAFLAKGGLPKTAMNDAAHIAFATAYNLDYLLTWNCRHIANPHILKKLAMVAETLGFEFPTICTPYGLLAESPEEP
ncbi:MAG: type II toxin-antitoxin system VapC family toxin [Planctomycetaceae bacterium]|nr:type II toxin-antitoxin system VapC family toxin [Planctomycetaceae bacterium]